MRHKQKAAAAVYKQTNRDGETESDESSLVQTVLNDNVLHIVEHPFDVVLIRCARAMRVNVLLLRIPILGLELLFDERIRLLKAIPSVVVSKALSDAIPHFELFLKQILLIQKQNERRTQKPPRIADLLEQLQRFVHHNNAVVPM